METLTLFHELSDYIHIRNDVCDAVSRDGRWAENIVHPGYAVWVITSGLIHIRVCGQDFSAGCGDVVFFCPDCPYTASVPDGRCDFIRLCFDFALGSQRKALSGLNLGGVTPGDLIGEEARALRRAFEMRSGKSRLAALYLKGCVLMLIARLAELNERGCAGGRFPAEQGQGGAIKKLAVLEPAIAFINQHMYTPFTVKDVAASVNMSEKYFSTFFKDILGISPAQYVMQLRMNQARNYLYEDRLSIKEIASRLGYPDQYSFSKAFKNYFSIAPSKFKQELQKHKT